MFILIIQITIMASVSVVGLFFVSPKIPVHFTAVQGEDEEDEIWSSTMDDERRSENDGGDEGECEIV